jgi:hypothetical protein
MGLMSVCSTPCGSKSFSTLARLLIIVQSEYLQPAISMSLSIDGCVIILPPKNFILYI